MIVVGDDEDAVDHDHCVRKDRCYISCDNIAS